MRILVLTLTLLFVVNAFATVECETRVSAPVHSLARMFENALAQNVIETAQLESWIAGEWKNPFVRGSLLSPRFRTMFKMLSQGLSQEGRVQLKAELQVLLSAKHGDLARIEAAREATAEVLSPHVVLSIPTTGYQTDRNVDKGLSSFEGRPVLVRNLAPELRGEDKTFIFDPLNPDPAGRWVEGHLPFRRRGEAAPSEDFEFSGSIYRVRPVNTDTGRWMRVEDQKGREVNSYRPPGARFGWDYLAPKVVRFGGQPWIVHRRHHAFKPAALGYFIFQNAMTGATQDSPPQQLRSYVEFINEFVAEVSKITFRGHDYLIWALPQQIALLDLDAMSTTYLPAPALDNPEATLAFEYDGRLMAFIACQRATHLVELTQGGPR